jgi:hypothetical protein
LSWTLLAVQGAQGKGQKRLGSKTTTKPLALKFVAKHATNFLKFVQPVGGREEPRSLARGRREGPVQTTASPHDAEQGRRVHTDALECVSQFLHGIVATRVVRGTGAYSASLSFNMSKGVRQQERVRKMERVQWGPA